MPEENDDKQKKKIFGGKNLVLLGVLSVLIAVATTGVSLAIYHYSGDIYLDRSRPGFLPDESEINDDENVNEEYDFGKDGELTVEGLQTYIEKISVEIRAIDAFSKPFSDYGLSDEHLGIVSTESGEATDSETAE